jgi:hypothetical protein
MAIHVRAPVAALNLPFKASFFLHIRQDLPLRLHTVLQNYYMHVLGFIVGWKIYIILNFKENLKYRET